MSQAHLCHPYHRGRWERGRQRGDPAEGQKTTGSGYLRRGSLSAFHLQYKHSLIPRPKNSLGTRLVHTRGSCD